MDPHTSLRGKPPSQLLVHSPTTRHHQHFAVENGDELTTVGVEQLGRRR